MATSQNLIIVGIWQDYSCPGHADSAINIQYVRCRAEPYRTNLFVASRTNTRYPFATMPPQLVTGHNENGGVKPLRGLARYLQLYAVARPDVIGCRRGLFDTTPRELPACSLASSATYGERSTLSVTHTYSLITSSQKRGSLANAGIYSRIQ